MKIEKADILQPGPNSPLLVLQNKVNELVHNYNELVKAHEGLVKATHGFVKRYDEHVHQTKALGIPTTPPRYINHD